MSFGRNLQALFGAPYDLSSLEGKKLAKVLMGDDNESFAFVAEDGSFVKLRVEGDCCSHSWVEHITVPKSAIGKPLETYADYPTETIDNHEEYECLQIYEFRIGSPAGEVAVEFRNSSNGYYGGYIMPDSGGIKGMKEVIPQ